jgi:hypothetical protein
VEELEELNQSLRQRDKVKDDAIAQLSDQLVSLSARLQEIERRQDVGARAMLCFNQEHSRLQSGYRKNRNQNKYSIGSQNCLIVLVSGNYKI